MNASPAQPTLRRLRGADDLDLVADEWGDPDQPPVLLLHGGGQNRHAWIATASKLVDAGFYVLSVDARGHGDSEWDTQARYDMDDMGRDVHALLELFDTPPAVVGASMGGMAAITAQGQAGARQLWSSVTLVDVTPRVEIDGAARIVAFMTANPNGFDDLAQAAGVISAYNPHRPASTKTDGLRRVLRQSEDGRWRWRWDPKFMSSKAEVMLGPRHAAEARMQDMATRLLAAAANIAVPTLLVRGGLSDLVSDDTVAEFKGAVPHAEFVDVSHAGHMVAGDDNDAFAAAIIAFLRATLSD